MTFDPTSFLSAPQTALSLMQLVMFPDVFDADALPLDECIRTLQSSSDEEEPLKSVPVQVGQLSLFPQA
jgi:hypothetical protein